MEWLRMVKEHWKDRFQASLKFYGEACKWWRSLAEDTRLYSTWKEFEKLLSDKWIRDTKMEELYRIQDEFKEANEEIRNKGQELSKIQSLKESLIKEVKNLKQENSSKAKWEKDESMEDLKKKDEEICRLRNHNKKLLDEVKKFKEEKKNC